MPRATQLAKLAASGKKRLHILADFDDYPKANRRGSRPALVWPP